MPTGYTSKIADGKETTLREFALRCARGMGALYFMRDAPDDAPIPMQAEPRVGYLDEWIEKAKARLAELEAMTPEERQQAADQYNADLAVRNAKTVADNDALRQRYTKLIAETEAWQGAPEGLKELMLQQLKQSLEFDVSDNPLQYSSEEIETAQSWYAHAVLRATRDLQYAAKEKAIAIERTDKCTAWIKQLHAALPATEKADG